MAKSPSKAPTKARATKVAAPPVTRMSVSDKNGAERSVEVRKIDNGYIVRESVYTPKKGYTSKERFSETAPTLDVNGLKSKGGK